MATHYYVSQGEYRDACTQACLAMICGISLEEVIKEVGPARLGSTNASRFLKPRGMQVGAAYVVEGFGCQSLPFLVSHNNTLWCSVYDALDRDFAHSVLIGEGDLLDPVHGVNPSWPWSRMITIARVIERVRP